MSVLLKLALKITFKDSTQNMSQPTLILRGSKEKLPFTEKLPILNTQVTVTVLGGKYNPFELMVALPHVTDRNRGLGNFAFLPIKQTIEKTIFQPNHVSNTHVLPPYSTSPISKLRAYK